MPIQRGEFMEAVTRWWREHMQPWKSRALSAEAEIVYLRGCLEQMQDELAVLKTKLAVLQLKARSDGKKVRRRI